MPSASCCFLPVFAFLENHYQTESKQRENFGIIFSGLEGTVEASGEDQMSHEGATSPEGTPGGVGAPPRLVGPSLPS